MEAAKEMVVNYPQMLVRDICEHFEPHCEVVEAAQRGLSILPRRMREVIEKMNSFSAEDVLAVANRDDMGAVIRARFVVSARELLDRVNGCLKRLDASLPAGDSI